MLLLVRRCGFGRCRIFRLGRGEWRAIDNDTLLVVDKLRNISEHRF
jgi:hypothetical protein